MIQQLEVVERLPSGLYRVRFPGEPEGVTHEVPACTGQIWTPHSWMPVNLRDPQAMHIIAQGSSMRVLPHLLLGSWLMHSYNQQRTACVAGRAPELSAATLANGHPTRYLRALPGVVVQVGEGHAWLDFGASEDVNPYVNWIYVLGDDTRGRLFTINGGGNLVVYSSASLSSPLETSALGGIAIEPLLLPSGLWVTDVTTDVLSWAWTCVDPGVIGTTLDTATMAWDGWGAAAALPHYADGASYTIFLTRLPLYGREASTSALVRPIVTAAGLVIPGEDDPFLEEMQSERDDPSSYFGAPNHGNVSSRSQLLAFDLPSDSRSWAVNGWGTVGRYEGFTPVLAAAGKVVAHWERATFSTVTMKHAIALADGQQYANLWMTPFGVNSDHSVAPALDGDLTVNRTITFKSVTGGDGTVPWPNDVNAPYWAWQRTEVDAITAEIHAYLEPTFGPSITRDYQSGLTHGLLTCDAATGAEANRIEWNETTYIYETTTDTGEPDHAPHGERPARSMYDGSVRLVEINISGDPDGESLHSILELDDDEIIAVYTAVEYFLGDGWIGQGSTSSVPDVFHFYQGHVRYGGTVDADGNSTFIEPGPIFRDWTDPDGRWSHHTVNVDYKMWVVKRKRITLTYADPAYGWDPRNSVADDKQVTDGTRIFLLPRRGALIPTPKIMTAYYPPGTRFDTGAFWGFECPHSSNGFSSTAVFPVESFPNAGWGGGPFTGNNTGFAERYNLNDFAGTNKYTTYDVPGKEWVPRGYEDAPLRTSSRAEQDMFERWSGGTFVFRHASPTLAEQYEGRIQNEYGNTSPWRWTITIPAWGYWFLGGNPLDDTRCVPVDYTSPETLFRGRYGDKPKGGVWRTPPETNVPWIPGQDDAALNAKLLVLNISDLSTAWAVDFGNLKLHVTPVGLMADGKFYLWLPGVVKAYDPETGTVLHSLSLPETETWTDADMIIVDGRIILAGSSGRYDITT